MKRIALTGNIGCGKSTVGRMFEEMGARVLDADRIIHSFYREGHPVMLEVVRIFGKEILDGEGNINKKKLAQLVFSDREKLRRLESITHRALYRELERIYKTLEPGEIVIVEASLFIEKGTHKDYDKTVVVFAPYKVCKDRALRKGFSEEDFKRRWENQMPIEEKVKYADYVIDNSGSLENTRAQVESVFEKIRRDP